MWKFKVALALCVSSAVLVFGASSKLAHGTLSSGTPIVLDSRIQSIEKFAELSGGFGFDLLISDGSNGFPRGLLVSSGPGLTISREIWHVSETGEVTKFVDGLNAAEGLAFGPGGDFGTDLYVSESRFPRIIRVNKDGNISSFATDFTPPFGPAGLAFGPGGAFGTDLYVADFTGGRIVTVDATGDVSTFALVTPQIKATAFDQSGMFDRSGDGQATLFTSTFLGTRALRSSTGPVTDDIIYQIDSAGNASPFVTGLTGPELLTFGPGGVFGSDLFVSSIGEPVVPKDGSVSFVDPSGNMHPFLGNLDATVIVFDVNKVLGGGAFVSECCFLDNGNVGFTIWHVTPIPPVEGTDTLTARVFIDRRCDRLFQDRIDIPLEDVTVTIRFHDGSSEMRQTTSFGMVHFSGFDGSQGATVSVALPANYRGRALRRCFNSPTTITLQRGAFGGHIGYKFVQFRFAYD